MKIVGGDNISQYIKWLCGKSVKVTCKPKQKHGYAAWIVPYSLAIKSDEYMKISRNMVIKEKIMTAKEFDSIDMDFLTVFSDEESIDNDVLWHECGHIHDCTFVDRVEDEYRAHMWAMNKAHERGYKNIVCDLIVDMNNWFGRRDCYDIAARKIKRNLPFYIKKCYDINEKEYYISY